MADVDASEPPDVLSLGESTGRGGRDAYDLEPSAAEPGDTTAPTLSNFTPALAADVQPGGTVGFDITDDGGTFSVLAVLARFEDAMLYDVVHDGNGWGPDYIHSTRAAIANGWRYTLRRRSGGWPREALKIRVIAADAAGNVVVL